MENYFGKNVKMLRKENNLTQSQLAKQVDLSIETIKNVETGLNCKIHTAIVLADYFHLTVQTLVYENLEVDGDDYYER